tara:strand:+ start:79195 stop:79704 length:510 start_codon:yes stop_codon:yes gene_type:complete
LNETGRKQAETLASFMKEIPLDVIYSSDLKRALWTAQDVLQGRDIELIETPKLRECDFGEAEGMRVSEIKDKFGEDFWNMFQVNGHSFPDLSFPGGESRGSSIKRVQEVIDLCLRKKYKNVAISTHGGIVRNYLSSHIDDDRSIDIFNCCLYRLKVEENQYAVEGPLNK